jgi:hypothetical protein
MATCNTKGCLIVTQKTQTKQQDKQNQHEKRLGNITRRPQNPA